MLTAFFLHRLLLYWYERRLHKMVRSNCYSKIPPSWKHLRGNWSVSTCHVKVIHHGSQLLQT